MGGFLAFRRMVTPLIIQIVFWVGIAFCLIFGLLAMVNSRGQLLAIIYGLVLVLIGPIFVRVICEMIITLFRIEENTRS
ncbi:MAG TPA: DUF4282 domain-containing protein [Alphaproteobacteria bacterium]|nr:DUF4282 domain-containing protein [Alphaproteobacteria bacterium]